MISFLFCFMVFIITSVPFYSHFQFTPGRILKHASKCADIYRETGTQTSTFIRQTNIFWRLIKWKTKIYKKYERQTKLRHFLLHNARLILYRKLLRSLAGFACWFWLFALFIFSRLDDPLVCFFFFGFFFFCSFGSFCFFDPFKSFDALFIDLVIFPPSVFTSFYLDNEWENTEQHICIYKIMRSES
jgi:hypothetical protein